MTNATKSDESPSFTSICNRRLKSLLRYIKHNLLGDPSQKIIKPINIWNIFYWINYTLRTDLKYYPKNPRPLSSRRLLSLLTPNIQNPVFIVGSPRSGTTFLGDCISQLPEISYHFEPVLTKAAARYVYTHDWNPVKTEWLYKETYRWLMRLHLDGDLRFVEKTPQISFIIPFLAKIFPDARFIHIVRDGRDVALSLAAKPWHQFDKKGTTMRDPDGYLCGPWARFWVEPKRIKEFETTNDLHRCIWIWRRHVEETLQASLNLPSHTYHELSYEDFIRHPEKETEAILDFLAITNKFSRQLFKQTVISQAKADSVGRWKMLLSSEQLKQLEEEAQPLMKKLGYLD